MRIAYGVHGFGRGHSMRARAVLPELTKRHEVLVLAGDDAYRALADDYDVVRIPVLKYYFNKRGNISNLRTIVQNASMLLDVRLRGPGFDMIAGIIEDFGADAVLTDSEMYTHWVARKRGIPRITFDHFGLLVYCRPVMSRWERLANRGNAFVYNWLYGQPERAVVSGFFDAEPRRAGVASVGPVIRDDVRRVQPTRGDHLLAYVNKGEHEFTPQMEAAFKSVDCPVRVYGVPRSGTDGNLEFKPISKVAFIEDLASCRAVFATCGNQLIGEVMYFGKPILGQPMACHEQRLNAFQIEHLGIGMRARRGRVTAELLHGFLAREDEFAANMQGAVRDGAAEAVAAIEGFLTELCPEQVPLPKASVA